jgi:hypothetical protein
MKWLNKSLIIFFVCFLAGTIINPNSTEAAVVKVKKQVIYNKDNAKIQVTGITKNKKDYELKFIFYNNSKKAMSASIESYAINNMSVGSIGWDDVQDADDVRAGNKSLIKLKINNSFMKKNHIDTIKKIDLVIILSSGDNESVDIQKTIKTNKDNKKYSIVKSKKIYSDKRISVSYIKKDGNNIYFLIKNTLGKYMDITFESCSVNDWSYSLSKYASDSLFDISMPKGSYYIAKFNVGKKFMNECDIKKIKKIGFVIIAETDIINLVIPTDLKYAEIKTDEITWSAK